MPVKHFKLGRPEDLEPCACSTPWRSEVLRYARGGGADTATPVYTIVCSQCGHTGPRGNSLFEAIKLWNMTRKNVRSKAAC